MIRGFILLLALALPATAAERVSFPGADGFEIAGTFDFPPYDSATVPGVLLLHDAGQDRAALAGLAEALVREGFAVLSIDLRGHGESTRQAGQQRRHKQFGPDDWRGIARDAVLALRWLSERPGVAADRLAMAGQGLGANVAAVAAGEDPRVRALALLSPGLEKRGFELPPALAAAGKRPVLLACGAETEDPVGHAAAGAVRTKPGRARVDSYCGGDRVRATVDFLRTQVVAAK